MKNYRVSPLLLFAALIVGALIVGLVDPYPQWGNKVILYLSPAILLTLGIDFVFQKYIKSNAVLWIAESIVIVIALAVTSQVMYG